MNQISFLNLKRVSPAAFAVLLFALTAFFLNIGLASLPSQDDAYQAQTTKEMMQRGDYIGITFGGTLSFQSSPFPNWLMALSFAVFGVNEFAARFPSALLAFLGVLTIYFFIRKRYDDKLATIAAFILTTSSLYLRYARHSMADIPLAFFTTSALLAFISAQKKSVNYWWFGLFTGVAILCKSALGLLPVIIAGLYFLFSRKWKSLFSLKFVGSIFLALAVASIWYLPAIIIYQDSFISSHFGAYLASHTVNGHHASAGIWGYFHYLIWFPIQYLPWTLLLIPALVFGLKKWKENDIVGPAWLMTVVPIVLLSFISTRYTRYLMPVFPPAAILIAACWHDRVNEKIKSHFTSALKWISLGAVIVLIVFPVDLDWDRNDDIRYLAPKIKELSQKDYVINYKLDHWRYQAPLLFYSDHKLSDQVNHPEEIYTTFPMGGYRLGLCDSKQYPAFENTIKDELDISLVDTSGSLTLFSLSLPHFRQWKEEFVDLLAFLPNAPKNLGGFGLPGEGFAKFSNRQLKMDLIEEQNDPRALFRMMTRKNAKYGIARKTRYPLLLNARLNNYKIETIASTDHLILFILNSDRFSSLRDE